MRHLAALGAMKLAGANHLFKLALELDDTVLQQTTVGFDLGFTRTAHKPAAAALAFKVSPGPDQTTLLVIKMRQIDLQRAFLGGGTAAENLEDQASTVDDLGVQFFFEIALLHRRQRMIDDDEAGIPLVEKRLDFLDLAGSHQGRWTRLIDGNDQALNHVEIDGAGKTCRLFQSCFIGSLGSGDNRRVALAAAGARLLEHRHNHHGAHIVPVLFGFRDERFVRRISGRNLSLSLGCVFFGLEHLHRLTRHDGRDSVLIHELGVPVTTKKHAEIVEGRYDSRELDPVDEEYSQGNLLLSDCIEK
ncbi:hypothetical protein D3C71_747940 [compost metagenome]